MKTSITKALIQRRMRKLDEKRDKATEEIASVNNEIQFYSDVVEGWKNKAIQHADKLIKQLGGK